MTFITARSSFFNQYLLHVSCTIAACSRDGDNVVAQLAAVSAQVEEQSKRRLELKTDAAVTHELR